MTDTPKPLTAGEIAEFMKLGPQFVARLKATIEQQAEQIEKLRNPLAALLYRYDCEHEGEPAILEPTAVTDGRKALAATEPKP